MKVNYKIFGWLLAGIIAGSMLPLARGQSASSTASLVAHWPFAEGSGATTADTSGNGNTATLVNSPVWVSGYNGGSALEFPGNSSSGASYVSAPNSATLADQALGSSITLCAWVKRSPASIGNYCSVVAKDVLKDTAPYHRNYELIFDPGSHIMFAFRNAAGTAWNMFSSSGIYTDTNNWHFYCLSYTYGSAASCALYVDGAAITGSWTSGNGSDAPASTSGGPVLIGTDGTGTAANGSAFDLISIYTSVLSSSQVTALYTNGTTGTSSKTASTTTLASSQNPAEAGTSITFTATVTGSGGTPSGTVTFNNGNNQLGSGTLIGSGIATFSTSSLTASGSPYSITATYSGNGNFAASTSAAISEVVTNAGTTTPTNGDLWALGQPTSITSTPVAAFRPTSANSVMAVNEMPNGTPFDTGNGVTWHDLSLEDFFTNSAIIIHALHAATHQNFMEISSQAYNGGNPLPLLFGQGYGSASTTTIAAGISNNVFYAYNGIGGVTDGSSAAAGRVGEFASASLPGGSAAGLASGATENIASITLSPGDWDLEGVVSFEFVAATVTSSSAAISTASGTNPTDGSAVACGIQFVNTSTYNSIPVPRKQLTVSAPTTVYLVGTCYFSGGSVSAFGQITARRMR